LLRALVSTGVSTDALVSEAIHFPVDELPSLEEPSLDKLSISVSSRRVLTNSFKQKIPPLVDGPHRVYRVLSSPDCADFKILNRNGEYGVN